MDRSTIHVEETTELEVTMPDGTADSMIIVLRSMDDALPRKVLKKWDRIGSKKRNGLEFDQKEQASIELLAACIADWRGYDDAGDTIECNDEERLDLLSNPATKFIRSQIDDKLGDVTSFLSVGGGN